MHLSKFIELCIKNGISCYMWIIPLTLLGKKVKLMHFLYLPYPTVSKAFWASQLLSTAWAIPRNSPLTVVLSTGYHLSSEAVSLEKSPMFLLIQQFGFSHSSYCDSEVLASLLDCLFRTSNPIYLSTRKYSLRNFPESPFKTINKQASDVTQ